MKTVWLTAWIIVVDDGIVATAHGFFPLFHRSNRSVNERFVRIFFLTTEIKWANIFNTSSAEFMPNKWNPEM